MEEAVVMSRTRKDRDDNEKYKEPKKFGHLYLRSRKLWRASKLGFLFRPRSADDREADCR